jgi:hypothetical protein
MRKKIYKIIKKYPQTRDNELIFLRIFFKIWKKKGIQKDFFCFDFTSYSRDLKEIFFAFILKIVKKKSNKQIFRIAGDIKNSIGDTTSLGKYAQYTIDTYFETRKGFTAVLRFFNLFSFAEKIYVSSGEYKRVKEFIKQLNFV